MSNRIWKYVFRVDDNVYIETRKNATFLDVQMQDGEPYMWFIVDDNEPKEIRSFVIYGTGHIIPDNVIGVYRKTFQEFNGGLVWHLFEV